MPRKTVKEVLMERDGMTAEEAKELIDDAGTAFYEYISNGDMNSAENVCEEFFGLEPDYIDEFI